MWIMVKVDNKDTRPTSMSHLFSNVSIIDAEQVNVCWVFTLIVKDGKKQLKLIACFLLIKR